MKDYGLYFTKDSTQVRVNQDSQVYNYEVEKKEKEDFISWVKNTF
jgi:hypothetical protein